MSGHTDRPLERGPEVLPRGERGSGPRPTATLPSPGKCVWGARLGSGQELVERPWVGALDGEWTFGTAGALKAWWPGTAGPHEAASQVTQVSGSWVTLRGQDQGPLVMDTGLGFSLFHGVGAAQRPRPQAPPHGPECGSECGSECGPECGLACLLLPTGREEGTRTSPHLPRPSAPALVSLLPHQRGPLVPTGADTGRQSVKQAPPSGGHGLSSFASCHQTVPPQTEGTCVPGTGAW